MLFNASETIPYFHVALSLAMQWALRTPQVLLLNKSLVPPVRPRHAGVMGSSGSVPIPMPFSLCPKGAYLH